MALGKNLTKSQSSKNADKDIAASGNVDMKNEGNKEPSESENQEGDEVTVKSYRQFCVFKSGREEYAVSINLVKEVVPYPPLAYVPQMPDYIKGMANVRGNIYGILELADFFKIENTAQPKYLLVLDVENYQMGIAIPDVPDTLMVSDDMIESLSASRLKSTIGQKYLKGIIKKDRRMIILFDILGMISSDKFTVVS
ncbi:chemotaxis protein CheW [Ekhidna sp.]|jgi:purine-binding chemotaxis protein CheW|uniref:chemotaxis protein CheW n=1 Tax=Ekhidna sp. TaxID=2608089 RepID=UPI0032F0425B